MTQQNLFDPEGAPAKPTRLVKPEFILLDYVQTLVQNGNDPRREEFIRARRYPDWIKLEVFRPWLVDLLRDQQVILITARSRRYREATMARIQHHGLRLVGAYFSPADMEPPSAKAWLLDHEIYPNFGKPTPGRYLALESNSRTREMYRGRGIVAMPVPYSTPWTALPHIEGPPQ